MRLLVSGTHTTPIRRQPAWTTMQKRMNMRASAFDLLLPLTSRTSRPLHEIRPLPLLVRNAEVRNSILLPSTTQVPNKHDKNGPSPSWGCSMLS
jgi:hypothetical protein